MKCMISSQAFLMEAMGKGNKALIGYMILLILCVLVILKHQGSKPLFIDQKLRLHRSCSDLEHIEIFNAIFLLSIPIKIKLF